MITEKSTPLETVRHLQRLVWDSKAIIDSIQRKCQHVILPAYLHPYDKKTRKIDMTVNLKPSGGIQPCPKCDWIFDDWYCKKSPTKMCQYDEINDPIGDHCLYCGNPNERK